MASAKTDVDPRLIDSDDDLDSPRKETLFDSKSGDSHPGWRAPRTYDSDDDDEPQLKSGNSNAIAASDSKNANDGALMDGVEKHGDKSANATVVFAVPMPELPFGLTEKQAAAVPPFVLYALPPAPLQKPQEGEKEGVINMGMRTWQEKEREAEKDATTIKNKAIGLISKGMSYMKNSKTEFLGRTTKEMEELRVIYPASFPSQNIQQMFTKMITSVKSAAIRNGVISTAVLPVVFIFDTLTFIPGPFEINAVYAAASWTAAARASSITNGIVGGKLPVNFEPDERLESLVYRLHQLAKEEAKPHQPMQVPHWTGKEPPMTGIELIAVLKGVVTSHLGLDAHEKYEPDNERCLKDLEECLRKGAREWLSSIG